MMRGWSGEAESVTRIAALTGPAARGSVSRSVVGSRTVDEAARWRRTLREEQIRHRATRAILRETNRILLGIWLQDRLADPSDFELTVGIEAITDPDGSIDWNKAERRVDELLALKPHLAATPKLDERR